MGVEYINIGSTNNLSEILCESKCGWLVLWFIFGERVVVAHCLQVSNQQQQQQQQQHHAINKPSHRS
jgi:hypothetical protein